MLKFERVFITDSSLKDMPSWTSFTIVYNDEGTILEYLTQIVSDILPKFWRRNYVLYSQVRMGS